MLIRIGHAARAHGMMIICVSSGIIGMHQRQIAQTNPYYICNHVSDICYMYIYTCHLYAIRPVIYIHIYICVYTIYI